MGLLDGQVAFITGAARGQGRSHAVRLAEEGADIVAVDLCAQPATVKVPGATPADLDKTAEMVEATGRRIIAEIADIRDVEHLQEITAAAMDTFGRLDIVLANAGIWAAGGLDPTDTKERQEIWQETIAVNLSGQFNTIEATAPAMIAAGHGGSIVITSSTAGLKAMTIGAVAQHAYTTAKHGLVGLMRNYAVELAPYGIRVNTVHPTGVVTPMGLNPVAFDFEKSNPRFERNMKANLLDVDRVDPVDISNAILYLVSDAGRYVTGVTLPVDAGFLVQ